MNYYKILGVRSTDSLETIKSSYRKLALKYHPDCNNDPRAKEMFQSINHAWTWIQKNHNKPDVQELLERALRSAIREHLRDELIRQQYWASVATEKAREQEEFMRKAKEKSDRNKAFARKMVTYAWIISACLIIAIILFRF